MRTFSNFAAAALTLALAVSLAQMLPAKAQSESEFNPQQIKAIEKIIKDYLIANPEVMFEVQDALQRKQLAQRNEALSAALPAFYRELDAMKADLAKFTVGDGSVTLIEFFDYNCGYCRSALPEVVKLTSTEKNVKVLFLEYPILSAGSKEASQVAVAAAKQGKYFEFHREMLTAGRASKASALKIAQKIGLDMDKVNADMASPETEALLAKIAELGRKVYVDGTPSFIAGDKITPGAADYDALKQMIEDVRTSGCKTCAVSGNDEKKS